MLSPNQVVKKVAKLVGEDNICYINRSSREITTIEWKDRKSDIAKELEKKIQNYIKVLPMSSQLLDFAMRDFLIVVTDQDVKKELVNGLKRNNPRRNFMQVVDSRYDIQAHWKTFEAEQCENYVKQLFVDEYNY